MNLCSTAKDAVSNHVVDHIKLKRLTPPMDKTERERDRFTRGQAGFYGLSELAHVGDTFSLEEQQTRQDI